MKKILSIVIALAVMCTLAAPVFAAEDTFVPSITYKPNPEIVEVEMEDGGVAVGVLKKDDQVVGYVAKADGCLRITPVADALDEKVEVPDHIRQMLLYVYGRLEDKTMELPYDLIDMEDEPMVVRDLFDVTFFCDDHPELLEDDGITLDLILDLGVEPGVEIYTMTFDEETEEWEPIVKTVNNGDGTVTCTFDHLCVISFSVVGEAAQEPASFPWYWILILLIAIVILIVIIKKNKKKEEQVAN